MRSLILSIFILSAAVITTSGTPIPGNSPKNSVDLARQFHEIKFTQNKGQVIDNNGQLRPDVLFSAGNNDFKFYFTKKGIIYAWIQAEELDGTPYRKDEPEHLLLKRSVGKKFKTYQMSMELIGANPQVAIQAEDPTPDVSHFFLDHCPDGIMNVQSYQKIVYKEIYSNIDFVVYKSNKGLKYDFIVKPGGKISDIKLSYTGSQAVRLNLNGTLKIDNLFGSITEGKPYTYQMIQGKEKKVYSKYVLQNNIISFKIGKYNPLETITIDPFIAWASYYGGSEGDFDPDTGEPLSSGNDEGNAVATDHFGNVYLAGRTTSITGIAHNGVDNEIGRVGCCGFNEGDAFLVKFTPSGQRVWATYYGIDGYSEIAKTIAVDAGNNVYLSGSYNGVGIKNDAAFLIKFSATGGVSWIRRKEAGETDDGFFQIDYNVSVAADQSGNVYLSGSTDDPTFIPNPLQSLIPEFINAFLIKYNSAGDIEWGTYLGGSEGANSRSISVDNAGNIYLGGETSSITGIALNGHQNTYGGAEDGYGGGDAFLVKFDSNGTRIWGTYYGGSNHDYGNSVAIDREGNILLAGSTQSTDSNFTTPDGCQPVYGGSGDAFLVKFDPSGTRIWGTYYGKAGSDEGNGVCTDLAGNIYLIGVTSSQEGMSRGVSGTTIHQEIFGGGGNDAFIVKIDDADPLLLTSFPENAATNIPSNTALHLTFNEPMKKGAGEIIIKENGTIVQTIPINNSFITIDNTNNSVNITLPTPFTSSAKVSIEISVGALKDLVDRNFEGFTPGNSWGFTIKDEAPPVFSIDYPKIASVTTNAFEIEVQLDEACKVYYVVVPDGDGQPTPEQVKAGITKSEKPAQQKGTIDVTAANTNVSKSVTGLEDSQDYDIYLIAEDLLINLQKVVVKLDLRTTDDTPPTITKVNIPDSLSFNTSPSLSFKVRDNISIGKISVYWVGLTKEQSLTEQIDIPPSPIVDFLYTINLPEVIDEIGIQYIIMASDGSDNETILAGKMAVYYPEGINMKNFDGYGDKTENYDLISIPLQLKSKNAEEVLSVLDEYDPTLWRLFMYRNLGAGPNENEFVEYNKGFTDIEIGRGYWLLIRNKGDILNTGAGSTAANLSNIDYPFSVELQQGYNLIGNPYNFKLDWQDIKNDPRNEKDALQHFKIYENGNAVDGTVLEDFGGAFVFATKRTTLYFPTKKNLTINSGKNKFNSEETFDGKNWKLKDWKLKLTFLAGEGQYAVGGVGMQSNASLSKDEYDDITLPRFLKWTEINFSHPEYFYPNFCRDIVPPQGNYIWEFISQTNIVSDFYQIKWDKNSLAYSDKSFVLYDVDNQVVVDMKLKDSYRFSSIGSNKFKIFYGSMSFIEDNLLPEKIYLGKSFPNPFTHETSIPFTINGNQNNYITIQIYDLTGRKIITLFEGTGKPGFNSIKWDGRNKIGEKMPSGIYLCKMVVWSELETKEFTEKLVFLF